MTIPKGWTIGIHTETEAYLQALTKKNRAFVHCIASYGTWKTTQILHGKPRKRVSFSDKIAILIVQHHLQSV